METLSSERERIGESVLDLSDFVLQQTFGRLWIDLLQILMQYYQTGRTFFYVSVNLRSRTTLDLYPRRTFQVMVKDNKRNVAGDSCLERHEWLLQNESSLSGNDDSRECK